MRCTQISAEPAVLQSECMVHPVTVRATNGVLHRTFLNHSTYLYDAAWPWACACLLRCARTCTCLYICPCACRPSLHKQASH